MWDEVDMDSVKWEKRPVGKIYLKIQKLVKGRWKQLGEDAQQTKRGKLWREKHRIYFSSLQDYEGDDVEEFPGYDYFGSQDDDEEPTISWINPPKGPGEFAKKKKKKSKKTKNKKKNIKTEL